MDNPLKMKLAQIEAICVRALACGNSQDDYIRALEEIQCEVACEIVEHDIGEAGA